MSAIQQLTPHLINGFTQEFLHRNFDDPVETPDCHMEWWGLMCNPHPRVAIAAPRGHAKSTAISFSFALAATLFRFRKYVLIVSDTSSQAEEFLGDIRRELEENEELITLFGVTFPDGEKNNQQDLVVALQPPGQKKPHYFRISARGSGKSLRGLKWRGMRPDLVLGDDLENDEMVENDERREKFRKWFNNALLQVISKRGLVRIVGTILHFDSLLERKMPKLQHPDTVITPLKIYSNKEKASWLSIKYMAHDGDDPRIAEEFLWPEQWSQERLADKQLDYIDDGDPEGYAQEYLNNPLAASTALFKKENMIGFSEEQNGSLWNYYCGVDLAISTKDKRAYTVFSIVGINHSGMARVFDVHRFRGDSLEIIEKFFEVASVYTDITFIVEKENIARVLGPILYKEMELRDKYLLIEEEVPSKDKRQRSASYQARVKAKRIEFNTESDWWPAFLTEHLQFDKGQYMDQVDATGIIFMAINKLYEAPTVDEAEEDEWDADYDDYLSEYDGRSSITGY